MRVLLLCLGIVYILQPTKKPMGKALIAVQSTPSYNEDEARLEALADNLAAIRGRQQRIGLRRESLKTACSRLENAFVLDPALHDALRLDQALDDALRLAVETMQSTIDRLARDWDAAEYEIHTIKVTIEDIMKAM